MPRRHILLLAVLVEAGMGVAAVLGAWIFGVPMHDWVHWSLPGLLWGLAGAAILFALLILCRRFPLGPIGRLMDLVDRHVKPLFRESRILDLLLIAILAGVGEELLFRGLLQSWLAPLLGPWPALVIVSILFGLAHCLSREYFLFAAILGALLGTLALLTGDLLAPIVAHAGYDFAALLILTRDGPPSGPSPSDDDLVSDSGQDSPHSGRSHSRPSTGRAAEEAPRADPPDGRNGS